MKVITLTFCMMAKHIPTDVMTGKLCELFAQPQLLLEMAVEKNDGDQGHGWNGSLDSSL